LDDEFAKGVGDGYDSLESLREFVKKQLDEEAERAKETQHREATLDELLKVAEVKLPPLLIENEVERMVERRDRFVDRLNIPKDDYLRLTGKSEDEIQEEMHEHAIERISRSYALMNLAEQEALEVSDAEVDEKIKEIADSASGEAPSLDGHDMSSDAVRESVRETLLVDKAVDRLVEIAKGEALELVASVAQKGDEEDVADTKA
jgi:trigger factor